MKKTTSSAFATVGRLGNGQNVARKVYPPERWSERDSKTGTSFAIIERATKAFNKIKKLALSPAARQQLAILVVLRVLIWSWQDHAGAGHDALMAARNQLLALAAENPELTRVRHNGLDDSPAVAD
ncbi:efflux RND transporter permease subunit [Escherichia coli]